ncbi:hypothetical protein [Vibrio parahaemolyticus]|nr:hypothetical protein [Vibrio parahaemolyticus]
MEYKVTLSQLQYLVDYARCGLAHNGRDMEKLKKMVDEIQSKKVKDDE